jgi:hypothetical protein
MLSITLSEPALRPIIPRLPFQIAMAVATNNRIGLTRKPKQKIDFIKSQKKDML